MKVPEFSTLGEVSRYLIDLAKEREDLVKQFITKQQANHSVLLMSPDGKIWEVTVSNAGALVVTLIQG